MSDDTDQQASPNGSEGRADAMDESGAIESEQ